jgi:hypothetical protein
MKSSKYREFGQTAQQEAPIVQPVYVTEGSGAIVVIAITLFSIVVMFITSRNSDSAWSSIWGTVIFFSIALPTGLMAANGTFGSMFRVWQEQRTILLLNRPDAPQHTLEVVQHPQLSDSGPVAPLQERNFVSPYAEADDSVMSEAKAWLVQLYTKEGTPDPAKVLLESDTEKPGRIRIKGPSRPAKQYLLDRGIIHDLGNGYRLNMPRCSTILGAQNNLLRTPVPGGSPTHHPPQGVPPTLEGR